MIILRHLSCSFDLLIFLYQLLIFHNEARVTYIGYLIKKWTLFDIKDWISTFTLQYKAWIDVLLIIFVIEFINKDIKIIYFFMG